VPELLVGLDVGTTGARAVAVRTAGEVEAQASTTYPVHAPRPGWSEQHPQDWVEASRAVLRSVASQAGGEVAAVGLTGQMHGSVFLDGAGQVIRPALLWNDQRTYRQAAAMSEELGERVQC
jgi:xylulokinase